EIERLLKRKIPIETADGFDAAAAARGTRERPARSRERGSATRGHARGAATRSRERSTSTHDATGSRSRRTHDDGAAREAEATARERIASADARRAEREAAYAKNPDQPLAKNAANGDAHAHEGAHRRTKAVPMLLQKRRAAEPEKVG